MADYDYYIDFEAITCGDIAFSRNQFNVSTLLYELALKRLMKYPGDRMLPINMAGSLKNNLKKSKLAMAQNSKQKPLTYRTWRLSKTSFVAGKQCLKQLYLDKFKKEEKSAPSDETKELWSRGREFEDLVRKKMFPIGIDVKEAMASKWNYFSSYTDNALEHFKEVDLFEATLIENGILVMVDMLHKHKDGEVDLYEIKLHRELTEVVLWDLSIQYYVAQKRFGEKIRSFNVVLSRGEEDFEVMNVKEDLEKRLEETGKMGIDFLKLLQSASEPEISMGTHCDLPYSCGFKEYCSKKELISNPSRA